MTGGRYSSTVVVICIVMMFVLGAGIRLLNLKQHYMVWEGDVARDYIMARNIKEYGEHPYVGPVNSIYKNLRNSPFYYYYLSAFLFVKDDIYTLAYVNVIQSVISMGALTALGGILFGWGTALLIAVLLNLNQEQIIWSTMMWQPYAALPFFSLSYLMLAIGYTKKYMLAVYLSVFLFAWALGLGFYGVPALPVFVMLVNIVVKRLGKQGIHIFGLATGAAVILAACYLPVISSLLRNRSNGFEFFVFEPVYVHSPMLLLGNIAKSVWKMSNLVFYQYAEPVNWPSQQVLVVGVIMLFVLYFIHTKKDRYIKYLVLYILSVVLVAAIVSGRLFTHYYISVAGAWVVALAAVLVWSIRKSGLLRLFGLGLIILAIPHTLASWRYVVFRMGQDPNYVDYQRAVNAMITEVTPLKQEKNGDAHYPFRIVVYNKEDGRTYSDGIFWVPLEKALHTRLVHTVNPGSYYVPIYTDDVVYVVCNRFEGEFDARKYCLGDFLEDSPSSKLTKTVYKGDHYLIFRME